MLYNKKIYSINISKSISTESVSYSSDSIISFNKYVNGLLFNNKC